MGKKELEPDGSTAEFDDDMGRSGSTDHGRHGDDLGSEHFEMAAEHKTILTFEPNDPSNPVNWKSAKKFFVLFVAINTVFNSTMGSSLASGATTELQTYFHIKHESQLVLPTSIYLVGYVVGPFVFGPLSETFGRKHVMIMAFTIFTIFNLACALAPTWAALIIFRLICGTAGSCPIAVVGGQCADIFDDPSSRGIAMAVFMASTTLGPVVGPIVSGFISVLSWRWVFWFGLIFAGVTWIPLLLMPESYAPLILKKKAQALRKERPGCNIYGKLELEGNDLRHVLVVVLMRPIRMVIYEPIVLFTCLYLSFAYAVFYMFFQSYPIIFGATYKFNPGEQGLAFIPIIIGSSLACGGYLAYDAFLRRAFARKASWTKIEEYRRLPLACMAGPFIVIAMFWTGWTARPDIHWAVPASAGIFFGIGFLWLFMALLNYLVDAYSTYAASAMAAASMTRSVFGAVMPLAARPMYHKLGIAWACSLLGFVFVLLCIVPFFFIKFGSRMRERSKFCQQLAREQREAENMNSAISRSNDTEKV